MGVYELKQDLLNLDSKEFFIKHIAKSKNWYFSNYLKMPTEEAIDCMDYFKEIVSKNFEVGFHATQIVGSAKTGFSLSPSNKLLKPFHDAGPNIKASDIDIAIVSGALYRKIWEDVKKYVKTQERAYYRDIAITIFWGHIDAKDFMNIEGIKKFWNDRINPVNKILQDELCFEHEVSYRIYRSWEDLEAYQLSSIDKARHKLEMNNV